MGVKINLSTTKFQPIRMCG